MDITTVFGTVIEGSNPPESIGEAKDGEGARGASKWDSKPD